MAILYIVATPIGNLQDITLRALETLRAVDFIICEDTRLTKRLLERHQIDKPTISFHQHSSGEKTSYIIEQLKRGQQAAFVSDAGTPGVSDPGNQLVAAAVSAGITVVPIPGPSALTTALSVAGIATDSFLFLGFPPHKKGRQTLLRSIAAEPRVVVLYESSHRIVKLLGSLAELAPDRTVVVGRELTKIHEEIFRGTAREAFEHFSAGEQRGEFVVIIEKLSIRNKK